MQSNPDMDYRAFTFYVFKEEARGAIHESLTLVEEKDGNIYKNDYSKPESKLGQKLIT